MIVFRCIYCPLENLSADVLRCPRCGEETFALSEPEPLLQPIEQTTGPCQFEPHTSMLSSYPESVITNLKCTGNKGKSSSPDLLNEIWNSSSRNFNLEYIESINEVAQLEAHTSNPQTRKEGPKNASAMLPKDSSASTSNDGLRYGKCPRRFRSESAFNVHVPNDCDPNPHKCNKCPFKCSVETLLILHQIGHTEERPFKCDYCNYASNREDCLKRHIDAYHRE